MGSLRSSYLDKVPCATCTQSTVAAVTIVTIAATVIIVFTIFIASAFAAGIDIVFLIV